MYLRGTVFGRKLRAILENVPDDGEGHGSYEMAKMLGYSPQTVSNMLNDIYEIHALSAKFEIAKSSLNTITIKRKSRAKKDRGNNR